MSLVAKFEADFMDFYNAVAKATTSLETWEKAGADVERQMNEIGSSVAGADITQETTAAAGAMDQLGTSAAEVPPHLQNIGQQASFLDSAFGQLAAGIAGAFTVQAITSFALGVAEAASEIGDLSERLGISTDAVQRFGYAADQSGASIGDVERAISGMNQILAEGNDSTIAILNALGLDLAELRAQGPEQTFIELGDAVGSIEDPMLQAKVATELFTKTGLKLLPAFKAGIGEVGADIELMTKTTIAGLKEAQDQWSSFMQVVTVKSAGVLEKIIQLKNAMWTPQAIGETFEKAFYSLMGWEKPLTTITEVAVRTAKEGAKVGTEMEAGLQRAVSGIKMIEPPLGQLSDVLAYLPKYTDKWNSSLYAVEKPIGTITDFINTQIQVTEKWNKQWKFTSEVIGELPAKLDKTAAAIDGVTQAQEAATAPSKFAPGGVSFATPGIQFGDLEGAFKEYSQRYSQSAIGGGIGGGPAEDFVTWALRQGKAIKSAPAGGGAAVTNNINLNGLLGTNDPQTKQVIKQLVGEAFTDAMRGSRLYGNA